MMSGSQGVEEWKDHMLSTGRVTETEWDLDTEASFCPLLLVERFQPPKTFLEFQRANYQIVANQEKETLN